MKFTTTVYLRETFHSTKDLGVTHRTWEGVVEKPLKKSPKTGFLASFLGIFSFILKTVTYAIRYLALHHW